MVFCYTYYVNFGKDMNLIMIITVCIIFKLGEAAKSIFIHQEAVTKDLIKITCTVSGNKAVSYKIYLHCPLVDTNFCYKDCSPECRYENENCIVPTELKSIENCHRKVLEDDHIQIEYTINPKHITNVNGEWYCSFEGVNSKSIKLNITKSQQISFKTTIKMITKFFIQNTKKPILKPIKIHSTKIPVFVLPKVPQVHQQNSYTESSVLNDRIVSKKESEFGEDINFRSFITKYQVVIGIICLMCISILLNFIFCIRDSLIKQFIENIKTNNSSSKLLLFCICQNEPESLTATARLDKILSKESDYASNGASNCSKNDIFTLDTQRPLIQNVYGNNDSNPHIHPNIRRSTSLISHDVNPRVPQMNYDHLYVTNNRQYPQYVYNPYVLSRTHLPPTDGLHNSINQRYSHIFPSQIIPQDIPAATQMHNNKMHGSENDIDLIRHCDSQEELQETVD